MSSHAHIGSKGAEKQLSWVYVGGGGIRPNTATSRRWAQLSCAFASTTLSIVSGQFRIIKKKSWNIPRQFSRRVCVCQSCSLSLSVSLCGNKQIISQINNITTNCTLDDSGLTAVAEQVFFRLSEGVSQEKNKKIISFFLLSVWHENYWANETDYYRISDSDSLLKLVSSQ